MIKLCCVALVLGLTVAGQAFSVGNDIDGSNLGAGVSSDSESSNGTYYYQRTVADDFSLAVNAEGYKLTSVQWYGFSEAFIHHDLRNISGFELAVYSGDPNGLNSLIGSTSVSKADASPQVFDENFGNPIYSFQCSFGNPLLIGTGGTYWVQIGAVLAAPEGDAFMWCDSETDNNLVKLKEGFPWSEWHNEDDLSDVAFHVNGDVVPEPMGLLTLAATLSGVWHLRKKPKKCK